MARGEIEPVEDGEGVTARSERIPVQDDRALRRNRRKMAWTAMMCMQVVMLLVLFKVPESKLQIIGEIIIWYFFSMATVIGGYIGFSTVFDMKGKK